MKSAKLYAFITFDVDELTRTQIFLDKDAAKAEYDSEEVDADSSNTAKYLLEIEERKSFGIQQVTETGADAYNPFYGSIMLFGEDMNKVYENNNVVTLKKR